MARRTKYYHATPIDNWSSVIDEGLRAGYDGAVHLTTNKDRALGFVGLYRPGGAVSLFYVDNVPVEPHYDGTASGDDCYIHKGSISRDAVTFVNNYHPSRQ